MNRLLFSLVVAFLALASCQEVALYDSNPNCKAMCGALTAPHAFWLALATLCRRITSLSMSATPPTIPIATFSSLSIPPLPPVLLCVIRWNVRLPIKREIGWERALALYAIAGFHTNGISDFPNRGYLPFRLNTA